MKNCVSVLALCVTSIINASLQTGYFSLAWRKAIVSLLLKKFGFDEITPGNYRPVSSVTFLLNVLELVVHREISSYLIVNKLMVEFQSAYRPGHYRNGSIESILGHHWCDWQGSTCASVSFRPLSRIWYRWSSYPMTAVAQVFLGWRDCIQCFDSYLT